ncbi:hypothetical protein CEXT_330951 [Caerostris extrusa]|uniref:Uncharacterized protein n=1 Tax=Caerostris extrusa TaxID=172846 RepID=A0AAV4XM45_CAEEX|nr:hypothetical protein CEXT_330951 [Caerostris extrusa]
MIHFTSIANVYKLLTALEGTFATVLAGYLAAGASRVDMFYSSLSHMMTQRGFQISIKRAFPFHNIICKILKFFVPYN